jgi:RNA-directed DNA polymerase
LGICFQYKPDAERFRDELSKRLGKFGLEVEPTKTKVMEFGRFAVQNAKRRGERAETFDFLGFTHYCGTRRDGSGFRRFPLPEPRIKVRMFGYSVN